jgi:hypothetical protein
MVTRLKRAGYSLCITALILINFTPVSAQTWYESENLLLNPSFEFHSFINHREGIPVSYESRNVVFWNTAEK